MHPHAQIEQLSFDFFIPLDKLKEQRELEERRKSQRKSWNVCWNWYGPRVGEPLEVDATCVKRLGEDHLSYWFCAPCIAEKEIEPDVWVARVEYPEDAPLHCRQMNGTRLVLDVADIWAPTRHLTSLRGN